MEGFGECSVFLSVNEQHSAQAQQTACGINFYLNVYTQISVQLSPELELNSLLQHKKTLGVGWALSEEWLRK